MGEERKATSYADFEREVARRFNERERSKPRSFLRSTMLGAAAAVVAGLVVICLMAGAWAFASVVPFDAWRRVLVALALVLGAAATFLTWQRADRWIEDNL